MTSCSFIERKRVNLLHSHTGTCTLGLPYPYDRLRTSRGRYAVVTRFEISSEIRHQSPLLPPARAILTPGIATKSKILIAHRAAWVTLLTVYRHFTMHARQLYLYLLYIAYLSAHSKPSQVWRLMSPNKNIFASLLVPRSSHMIVNKRLSKS